MSRGSALFKKGVLRGVMRSYRWRICLLSLLTVLLSVLQVLLAVLTRSVIDAAVSQSPSLIFWGGALAVDILLLVASHGAISWFSGSTADRFAAQLRKEILRSAVYSRDVKLQGYHSGELLNRGLEDVNALCDGVIHALPALMGQVTRLAATFAAVVMIYPPLALILLVLAGIIGAAVACMRPAFRKRHRAVRQMDEKVMANMQEDLQQLELIQSLEVQKPILEQMDGHLGSSLHAKKKRRLWSVGLGSIVNAVSQVGSGVMLLWGATQIAVGALSYGSLTSMLQLLSLFRGPVLGLSGMWTRFAAVEVSVERLETLLQEQPASDATVEARDVLAVVFEDVTFAYPGDDAPVLEHFSFRFPLEGWTCLTGISGRGKSTLFKLILGLYEPLEGRICLQTADGLVPCSEATRHLFAYVPQDYALFSGTVLENLQLVAPDADAERLRKALSVAQVEFLLETSDKEQTHVGENNTGLSKGQLQRLAIARAILMERPVFLLDECTSALDAQTEKAVLRELKALGKHAIIVTHRPEALADIPDVTGVSMDVC